jgi:hypothetical protein
MKMVPHANRGVEFDSVHADGLPESASEDVIQLFAWREEKHPSEAGVGHEVDEIGILDSDSTRHGKLLLGPIGVFGRSSVSLRKKFRQFEKSSR